MTDQADTVIEKCMAVHGSVVDIKLGRDCHKPLLPLNKSFSTFILWKRNGSFQFGVDVEK